MLLVFISCKEWFLNKLKWYEIIIFLGISKALVPFVLNKFYYNYEEITKINSMKLDSTKEIQIKITRPSLYGERYKLFVISKNTFEDKFTLEDYGITLMKQDDKVVVDNLKWNGEAKKSGFEMGDYISEFKIENSDRPSKNIVYPIAILLLVVFGYFNLKRKE